MLPFGEDCENLSSLRDVTRSGYFFYQDPMACIWGNLNSKVGRPGSFWNWLIIKWVQEDLIGLFFPTSLCLSCLQSHWWDGLIELHLPKNSGTVPMWSLKVELQIPFIALLYDAGVQYKESWAWRSGFQFCFTTDSLCGLRGVTSILWASISLAIKWG